MKKFLAITISIVIIVCLAAACGAPKLNNDKETAEKISVITTIFPEYDWVKEIIGENSDNVEIKYLLDKGADLHNFQPSANDMIAISECDLFIYVGGESDEWVEDALSTAKNKDMLVINLMEVMGDKAVEEEVKEGMEAEEEEEGEEEEVEYDEHFWTSLKNAVVFCNEICDAFVKLDSANADTYKQNTAVYVEKLIKLDEEFTKLTETATTKTLIFGDRFPFRYLTDDYGLDYYAAFVGCSAETEASFETIAFLAGKVDELNADTIFVIENSDEAIAKAIIANTQNKNQKIAELNSMQSVTADMVESGTTYLDLMQKNYDVLKEALS